MTLAVGRAAATAILAALLGAASLAFFYAASGGLHVDFSTDPPPRVVSGLYPAERVDDTNLTFAWTRDEVTLRLPELDRSVDWTLGLRVRGARSDPRENPELTFSVDGLLIATHQSTTDFEVVRVTIPARPERRRGAVVSMRSSTTFVPPGDPRPLGVMLDDVTLRPGGIVLPPRRAFTGTVAAGAAYGAAVALLGITSGSAIGAGVLVSTGLAAVVARGFAPFTPFPAATARLSLWIGIAIVLIVLGVERVSRQRLRNTARFVAAFSAGALLLKLAILLHPDMPIGDAMFHAHRFQTVLAGNLYFTSIAPGGYLFPYAPGLYVFAAPLAGLVRRGAADMTLLRIVVVTVDVAAGALLYRMVVRAWGDRKAGAIAVAVYQLVPLDFRVMTVGNLTNAFAQALSIMALAVIAAGWLRWEHRWAVALLVAALSAAFLSHTSSFAILCVGAALAVVAFLWRGGPVLRSPAAAVAVSLAVALALSAALYYGHFLDTYRAELARIGTETAAAAPDAGGRGIGARLSSVPLYLANHLGIPALVLTLVGIRRLWRQGARDRLTLSLAAWAFACLLFLLLGVLTPVDMRYYLASIPAVAIAAGVGASWLWGQRGYRRLLAAALLAWIAGIGVETWWKAIRHS